MSRWFRIGAAVVTVTGAILLHSDARGQTAPPATADEHGAILKELRAIRLLLEQQAARPAQAKAPNVSLDLAVENLRAIGQSSAPVTMVEFSDLECQFCRQFHLTTFQRLKTNYIDTGKIRYVAMDFPLDIHANAMAAARAIHCSAEQNKYWELRSDLVLNANKLSRGYIAQTAKALNMDVSKIERCIEDGAYDSTISAGLTLGTKAGVTGTPTFIIGRTTATGVDGVVLVGALPYDSFAARLDDAIANRP